MKLLDHVNPWFPSSPPGVREWSEREVTSKMRFRVLGRDRGIVKVKCLTQEFYTWPYRGGNLEFCYANQQANIRDHSNQ